jgi:hypothetical protein
MDAIKGLFGAPAQKPAEDSGTLPTTLSPKLHKLNNAPLPYNTVLTIPDFADFAAAPDPSPISIPASPADASAASQTGLPPRGKPIVYTKWYRVWERTSPSDFYMEMTIIPFIILALLVHFWGTRQNRKIGRRWGAKHFPLLESEFAVVGYHRAPSVGEWGSEKEVLEKANGMSEADLPEDVMKESTAWEYQTYATGRANVGFLDVKVLLKRRMNPIYGLMEEGMGMFFESVKPKSERMEGVLYTFDGNEKKFVPPSVPGSEELEGRKPVGNSSYDGFVFAVVNKMQMRKLRDERYDVSLAFTKDNAKLPDWATVMSESAEITETLLTKDLIAAITAAGDLFEYLVISDQPTDKPTTLDETNPKKRVHISLKLPSNGDYSTTLPLFQQFLRLPDLLVSSGKFRPEIMKKINATREAEKAKIKKVSDKEAAEERLIQLDKVKKEERDRKLKGMSAEEQKKYLEREAEKNRKKQEKKMSRKG